MKIKVSRPPNLSLAFFTIGSGVLNIANIIVTEDYLKLILSGISQAFLFVSLILKKPDTNTTDSITDQSNEPFTGTVDNPMSEIIIPNDPLDNDTVIASSINILQSNQVMTPNPEIKD